MHMLKFLDVNKHIWNLGDPIYAYLFYPVVFAASVYVVVKGANITIDSACRIANKFGISEIIIGLTVVSLGTSLPEISISFMAAAKHAPSISIGNAVGSNMFNLGFILGLSAFLRPLKTSRILVYRDGMVLLSITLVLLIFMRDNFLARWESSIFLVGFVIYIAVLIIQRNIPSNESQEVSAEESTPKKWDPLLIILGFAILAIGSHYVVGSAKGLAKSIGLSDWAIGVTIVAAGTSVPEMVTSLVAARKGKADIAIGNLVGSDIFNQLGIMGVCGSVFFLGKMDDHAFYSVISLVGMVTIVVLFMRSGWKIGRLEGAVLVLIAIGRMTWDVMQGIQ